jgi:hypothetical protein
MSRGAEEDDTPFASQPGQQIPDMLQLRCRREILAGEGLPEFHFRNLIPHSVVQKWNLLAMPAEQVLVFSMACNG